MPETMTVEQALELVLGFVEPLPAERVALLDALGRVLAEDATSDIDVAPFDNSAMDGFAVRAADSRGRAARTRPSSSTSSRTSPPATTGRARSAPARPRAS